MIKYAFVAAQLPCDLAWIRYLERDVFHRIALEDAETQIRGLTIRFTTNTATYPVQFRSIMSTVSCDTLLLTSAIISSSKSVNARIIILPYRSRTSITISVSFNDYNTNEAIIDAKPELDIQ